MFGHRFDGVNVSKEVDPIVLFTPLVMPTRVESMNLINYEADYEPLAAYIRDCKSRGIDNVSFVSILAAAYNRTAHHFPLLNYFIMGNRIYRHKKVTISLMVVRTDADGKPSEAEVKLECEPNDTIFDIANRLDHEVSIAKDASNGNGTADFAGTLLRFPVLPSLVVMLARLLDRIGLLPSIITKISPFHCSMFITNVMSIGLPSIFHHLYNFGTCSIFLSMGRPERKTISSGGKLSRKMVLPMGISTDERICGGADFAQGLHCFINYLKHPEILELSPEEELEKYPIKFDTIV